MPPQSTTCSIDGCDKHRFVRGWCSMHYSRWQRNGTPTLPPKASRPLCTIDGCTKPFRARGWCQNHYERWQRNGSPTAPSYRSTITAEKRFWRKVDTTAGPDACWIWTGTILDNGYGQFSANQRRYMSHRFAYELQVGPIPDGLVIDHLCRNRACQNARHLEPVTHVENVQRGDAGRYLRERTHCPRGHEYSGENLVVTKDGGRLCRTCVNARQRRRVAITTLDASVVSRDA